MFTIIILLCFYFSDLRVFIEDPGYRIIESDGPLEVCLELNYATDQPFTADLNIRENSPPEAEGNYILGIERSLRMQS